MKRIAKYIIVADYHLAAILLLIAGIIKVVETSAETNEILNMFFEHNLLNYKQIVLIRDLWPYVEISTGLYFLYGYKSFISSKLILFMYILFSVLIFFTAGGDLMAVLRCGCFGEGEGSPVYMLFLRNFAILIPMFFYSREYQSITLHGLFKRK